MHYDESKIIKTYITIDGKKVPLFKVPTGMAGPNASKIAESEYLEAADAEEEFTIEKDHNKVFDEENVYMHEDSRFVDY